LFIEKEALGFYEKAAKNVSDPRVKDMFTRLAEEEREHFETLQTRVRFLQPAISGKEKTRRHLELFVSNELKGKVVRVSETKAVQKFKSGMDALKFGIESEKCSIRNFIQSVGERKETGCESCFFAFDGCGKKHLALL
jgi:rubrerythrin